MKVGVSCFQEVLNLSTVSALFKVFRYMALCSSLVAVSSYALLPGSRVFGSTPFRFLQPAKSTVPFLSFTQSSSIPSSGSRPIIYVILFAQE